MARRRFWIKKANVGGAGQQIYEAKVGIEAINRVGRNKNLKGIVHEMMYRDKLTIKNGFSGVKAALSRSTTATRDDIVMRRGTKIIKRFQLKDTPASIRETIKQVQSGKYNATNLVGTKETVEAYSRTAKNVTKQMSSSGISSKTTSRVADKVLGKGLTKLATKRTLACAGCAGAVAAILEGIISLKTLKNGEITGVQYITRIGKEGIGGSIAGFAAEAGAVTAAAAVGAMFVTAPAWAPGAAGVAAGVAVGAGAKVGYDKLTDRLAFKWQPSIRPAY